MALIDSLVEYWTMNEASGNRAGSHAGLTLTDNGGVTALTGLTYGNGAFIEYGEGQSLTRADDAAMSAGDIDFSIGFAFLIGFGSTEFYFIRKVDGAAFEYQVKVNSSGQLQWEVWNSSGTLETLTWPDFTIADVVWYTVLVWHDSVANQIGMSVNGGTPVTAAWSTGVRDSDSNFAIGDNACHAIIGPVARWNKVFTAGERTQWDNGGVPLTYAALSAGTSKPHHYYERMRKRGSIRCPAF